MHACMHAVKSTISGSKPQLSLEAFATRFELGFRETKAVGQHRPAAGRQCPGEVGPLSKGGEVVSVK